MKSNESLLRLPAVLLRTGLSRSQVYALISRRQFPPPVRLSSRCSAWPDSEIAQWIDQRVRSSRTCRSGDKQ